MEKMVSNQHNDQGIHIGNVNFHTINTTGSKGYPMPLDLTPEVHRLRAPISVDTHRGAIAGKKLSMNN